MTSTEWTHKDLWHKRGRNFLVEISRHTVEPSTYDFDRGVNRWAVYAYIYPDHPHFTAFANDKAMWQPATDLPGLHYACSFLHKHESGGKVTSWQVGADYDHLHDVEFTHMETIAEAGEVVADAEALFAWLQEHDAKEPTP